MEVDEPVALWHSCFRGTKFFAEQVKQAEMATGLPNYVEHRILRMWTQQKLFLTTVASSHPFARDQTCAVTIVMQVNKHQWIPLLVNRFNVDLLPDFMLFISY